HSACSSPLPCFFFHSAAAPRHPHSFPTRRSSDLGAERRAQRPAHHAGIVGAHLPGLGEGHGMTGVGPEQRDRTSPRVGEREDVQDRKSTRLNSSHDQISYAVFCLKKKKKNKKKHE